MEGDGVTEPEFLDDSEKLFRESIRESFSWWRPRSLPRLNGPSINDLAAHRWWGGKHPAREKEPGLILDVHHAQVHADNSEHPFRKISMAFNQILAAGFHGEILTLANGHIPKYWRRRQALKDKHTNVLLFEDLVAGGRRRSTLI